MPIFTVSEDSWLSSPFFWALLVGVMFGAGVARIMRLPARPFLAEKARSLKWVLASIYFSLAILLALASVFVVGVSSLLDTRVYLTAAGVALLFFLAFRFRLAAGLPVLVLSMATVAFFLLTVSQWRPYSARNPAAQLRVLAMSRGVMQIEYLSDGKDSLFFKLNGSSLRPVISVLRANDVFFFRPKPVGFRVLRVEGVSGGSKVDAYDIPSSAPVHLTGVLDTLPGLLAKIPGWHVETIALTPVVPREVYRYGATLDAAGNSWSFSVVR